jgi:hypothetical protein
MAVINDPNNASSIMAVKAASTAPIATDPAAVVSISPNSAPLPVTGPVAVTQATAANLNAQVVGNVASGGADSGNPVKVGGKYNLVPITLADGQRGDVQLDANGYLKISIAAGAGGGIAIADGSTFTRGTSFETPAAGVAETVAPTLVNGRIGALSLNLSGGLRVDGSGVTQPISGTVTTTPPANASTNLTQLVGTAVDVNSGNKSAGTLRVTLATDQVQLTNALKVDGSGVTQPVSGTFFQATQPVSAASLPLPAGAATAAKQPALGTAGTASADVITIQGIAAMTKLLVTPDSVALPANQSVNISQMNGVATTMGNGVSGTGVQRVTIASDSTGQISQTAATMPAFTQVQNAAVANGNGTNLPTTGYATAILNIVSSPSMSGGTTINFEASVDNTTFVPILGHQIGVSGTLSTTTTTDGDFRFNVAGYAFLRARISAYSAGTINVKGYVSPLSAQPTTVTNATSPASIGTVQPGNTANTTPWLVTDTPATSGGLVQSGGIMPATPAKTVAKGSAGQIYSITCFNLLASPVFLKVWNNVTGSVTLGTTACDFQFMIPGNAGGAGFVVNIDKAIAMSTGIIFAVTNLISTTDNTAITTNSVIVNMFTK